MDILSTLLFIGVLLFAISAALGTLGIVLLEHRRGRLYRAR